MHYDYKRLRVDTAIHGDSSIAPGPPHYSRLFEESARLACDATRGPRPVRRSRASKKIMMERIERDYTGGGIAC